MKYLLTALIILVWMFLTPMVIAFTFFLIIFDNSNYWWSIPKDCMEVLKK